MASDIIIRPLRAEDHEEWSRLWTAYLAFYETELPAEVYQTAFSRLLSGEAGEFQGLIAEIDGQPVGLTHYLFHRMLWSIEDTCYLLDLYTDPSARGRGAGRALIEAVHSAAKEAGIPDIYWQTQEFNYKGRMLYDQLATRTPFIIYEKHG
ncbi:MAG: GNAT family N-acetyltransferase [Aestuariivita sp.]|uniref:GNAT family N-acetyltransferase n=1 Tax=Aestuariivita sp. TaxID=1872407 RepID=UPI003BAE1D02